MKTPILGLFVGKVEHRWPGRAPSAIGKKPIDGPLKLGKTGFELDQQADLQAHGGLDKAIHHYASDHYMAWSSEKPELKDKMQPGAVGENVATIGIVETDICVGDVFGFGTAKVQVSQGRQPCWKLNAHIDDPTMAANFQKTGRTGWYYRVLETGVVRVGDDMELIERAHADWPLNEIIAARFNPRLDPMIAKQLSELDVLAHNWRESFAKKVDRGFVENTDKRLQG